MDPHTQFLVENGIKPGAWVRVTGQPVDNRMTTCDVECEADVGTFAALPDKNLDSPYVVCYYDIETIGLQPEEGSCIQISLVFRKQGHPVAKHVVAVGTVDPHRRRGGPFCAVGRSGVGAKRGKSSSRTILTGW